MSLPDSIERLVDEAAMTDPKKSPRGPVDDTMTAVDTPPPYSEVNTSQYTPSTHSSDSIDNQIIPPDVSEEESQPPPTAERARAPFSIQQTNRKISGDYLILGEDSSGKWSGVHVLLQTTNAKIDAAIWAADHDFGMPFEVQLKTTNAKLRAAVHTLAKEQAVNVQSTTYNASNYVLLPTDFHGTVLLSTTNSSTELSPSLQSHAIRIAGPSGSTCYEIRGPGGPSRAEIKTTNAKAGAGTVGDAAELPSRASANGGSSCIIM